MTPTQLRKLDRELSGFLESMTEGMGRTERRRALGGYLTGLLLDGERKSIEPMAARLVKAPEQAEAMRQRLQQCVSSAAWDDAEMRRRLARILEHELPGMEALVIDDTGFPKKGVHSVGVARQYSGTLGRTENCQVAVSLHLAGEKGSGCIAMRMYLPEEWTRSRTRRGAVGVPSAVKFQKKWQIALSQLDEALAWGVRRHLVLADAGYGDARAFRDGVRERGLHYLMAVQGKHMAWPPGAKPHEPERGPGQRGRSRMRYVLRGRLVDGWVSRLDDGRRNPESVQGPTAAWRRCPPGSLEPPRAPAQAATVDSPKGIASRRGHHRR